MTESPILTNVRRARRYPLEVPVRFRRGNSEWLEGATVNISRLGLLIRTNSPWPPPSIVELQIDLMGAGSQAGPSVACSGRVLRVDRPGVDADALMAVTIEQYQLRPPAGYGESTSETPQESAAKVWSRTVNQRGPRAEGICGSRRRIFKERSYE